MSDDVDVAGRVLEIAHRVSTTLDVPYPALMEIVAWAAERVADARNSQVPPGMAADAFLMGYLISMYSTTAGNNIILGGLRERAVELMPLAQAAVPLVLTDSPMPFPTEERAKPDAPLSPDAERVERYFKGGETKQ